MSCALTQGFTLASICKDGIGGLSEVMFIEKGNIEAVTKAAGIVTAIDVATGKQFFKYELQRNTSSFEDAIESTPENGTVAYNTTLTVVLNRMQTAIRNEILLLAKNVLVAIAKDRNGKYWMLGENGGLDLSTGKSSTGLAATDRNGYELTFTGQEPELAVEVQSSIIAALLSPAA